jgi:hypothetical protein
VFTYAPTSTNSGAQYQFGNFYFPNGIDIAALNYGSAAARTLPVVTSSTPTMLFSSEAGAAPENWSSLQIFDLTGANGFVFLTGSETVSGPNAADCSLFKTPH